MISCHAFIATSLDGFIARENGDIDWLLSRDDPSEDHGYNDFIKDIDGIIMGRGTFEKVSSFENWFYTKPVIVLTQSLSESSIPHELKDKVRFFNKSPMKLLEVLEKEGWRNIYVDGGQVIQSFIKDNLLNDIVISTVPVLLGKGRSLFGQLKEDVSLRHLETKAFPSGLVQSKYLIRESNT